MGFCLLLLFAYLCVSLTRHCGVEVMSTVTDNLQVLAGGYPVASNAGSSRPSSCGHIPGSGGLILRQLCTRGGETQQNSKIKGISSRKDFSQVPVSRRVAFVDATLRFVARRPIDPGCRGWSQRRSSLGCVNLALSWCGDPRPALHPGTALTPGWIHCPSHTRRGRTHPPQPLSLLSPWERTRKVSQGVFVIWCFSLFELPEAAEGWGVCSRGILRTPLLAGGARGR